MHFVITVLRMRILHVEHLRILWITVRQDSSVHQRRLKTDHALVHLALELRLFRRLRDSRNSLGLCEQALRLLLYLDRVFLNLLRLCVLGGEIITCFTWRLHELYHTH
jgi:hypothetical protein